MINADRRVSLHEFVVLALVREQLSPEPPRAGRRKHRRAQAAGAARPLRWWRMPARAPTPPARAPMALHVAMRAGATEMVAPEVPAHHALSLDTRSAALEPLNVARAAEEGAAS